MVEEILNKITNLENIINSNSKKNTKRGQSTAVMIQNLKKQIKEEFKVTNAIVNRMRELQYEVEQLEAIKTDLTNQISYYNNMLADPRQTDLGASDIKNRIAVIERKIGTIEKLIEALKKAISNTLAYLKEYLGIWKKTDAKYRQFQAETGYQPLSTDQIGELIKSTDPLDQETLALYPQLSIEFKALQDEVLASMDNVELMETVKDQDSKRVDDLNKALSKYHDQLRYLKDLLVPMSEETFGAERADNRAVYEFLFEGGPIPKVTVEAMSNVEERIEDAEEELDEELRVVASLSFDLPEEISLSEVEANIQALETMDDLRAYRTVLRGLYTAGKISNQDAQEIAAMFDAKEAILQTPESMQTSPISLQKGSQVIANFDIFENSNLFASQGSTLTVMLVDNSKKSVILRYNNRNITMSFEEIENNVSTMNGLVNQTPQTSTKAPLEQDDALKVVESSDAVDAFMMNSVAVAAAASEADNTDIDQLENNLLNNLEC